MHGLRDLIQQALPDLVALRHDLHRDPELSFQEARTSRRVQRELDALGIRYKAGYAKGTGIVAHIPAGAGGRPAVALRADMDALPIEERSGVAYASANPGVMHACGHDGHTTMLLGAARVLSRLDQRPNPVTLIFQPAEEGGGGGEHMCKEGCLLGQERGGLGPPVSRIYGLHGWPQLEAGHVATRAGALLAATDDFDVIIRGTQAHAAYPHLGADPIVAASHVVLALQTFVSRNVEPADNAVLTVGQIQAGTANNIIPETCRIVGTIRTLRDSTRMLARDRFFALVTQTAEALGCAAEIDWQDGYPATVNDADEAGRFMGVATEALGAGRVHQVAHATMGGEDFAYYARQIPACFFFLGLRPKGAASYPSLHQPTFDFNDDVIPTGVEMLCRLALTQ